MTTVYSSYSSGWKPSNANVYRKYRARLDYSVSAETDTTITYKAVLYVNINSSISASYTGTLNLAGTTYSGSCETVYKSDDPVKTVTCVSAKTKTFTKGETATTATLKGGVKSSNGSWTGATVTATATVTIPAKRYAITFDANGGENPPAEQKKVHGTDLTLTTVVPTLAGYDFVSWNTASDGSGTSYSIGGTFSTDAITTLYAQWHISYSPPKIENLRAYRVDASVTGYNPNVKSDGTRCYCDFTYTAPVSGTTNSIKIQFGSSTAVNASSSSSIRYGYSVANHLATTEKETVDVIISITDYLGNSYTYIEATYISSENYIFDGFKGTSGSTEYQAFAVGGIARDFNSSSRSSKGNFDCYMDAEFKGSMKIATPLPVSSGGTGATTAAEARTNLGLSGSETRTLLWTNASPTSVFAGQTLSLGLSGYDAVEIVCRYSTTDDTRTRYICDVGSSSSMYWFYYTGTDGKYTGVRSRTEVSASTTGVTFNTCSGKPGNSTTSTANNGYIIPIEIYGVKVV